MGFGVARAGHDKGNLPLSTAEILWVWASQGYVAMSTAGMLWGWALQGYSAAGRCRNTLRLLLVTEGVLCCYWALLGYLVVGHCRDTLPLSTAVRLRAEGKDNTDC